MAEAPKKRRKASGPRVRRPLTVVMEVRDGKPVCVAAGRNANMLLSIVIAAAKEGRDLEIDTVDEVVAPTASKPGDAD